MACTLFNDWVGPSFTNFKLRQVFHEELSQSIIKNLENHQITCTDGSGTLAHVKPRPIPLSRVSPYQYHVCSALILYSRALASTWTFDAVSEGQCQSDGGEGGEYFGTIPHSFHVRFDVVSSATLHCILDIQGRSCAPGAYSRKEHNRQSSGPRVFLSVVPPSSFLFPKGQPPPKCCETLNTACASPLFGRCHFPSCEGRRSCRCSLLA